MIAANATELYTMMHTAVVQESWARQTTDPESPQTAATYEAKPGCEFELRFPQYNLQVCVPYDRRWAIANTLHFFAGTEDAEMLEYYNRHAARFAPGGRWVGAYGAIAMPQVRECVTRLREYPATRRAVVSMGAHSPQDINRPACWSFLQLLLCRHGLCLLVYQRSLNLSKVMPYDLVVLSNLLVYVARETEQALGSLLWTVGSLHAVELTEPNYIGQRHQSLILTVPPDQCLAALRDTEHEVWR